jgi:hypothetical protein
MDTASIAPALFAAPGVPAFAAGTLLDMGAHGVLFRKRPATTTSTGGTL